MFLSFEETIPLILDKLSEAVAIISKFFLSSVIFKQVEQYFRKKGQMNSNVVNTRHASFAIYYFSIWHKINQ